MNRNVLSFAPVAAFALLAVACGAAPGESGEATSSTSSAIGSASQCLGVPFTILETDYTTVGAGGGKPSPEPPGYKQQVARISPVSDEVVVYSCSSLVGPAPALPAAVYAANSIASCSQATVVPSANDGLASCTAGYQWSYPGPYAAGRTWDTWFLCPTAPGATTLPATTSSLDVIITASWATPPVNGCFGAAYDTADWGFVLVEETTTGGIGTGGCGTQCK